MLWLPYEQKQTWINLELRWDLKKKSKEPRCGKLQWRQLNHLILEMLCSNTGEEKTNMGLETPYPDLGPQKWKCLSQMSVGW